MSSSSSQLPWYIANTHPGAEDSVEQHIIRQGFQCFVPRQLRTERHAGRQFTKRSAFFPGYLFVSFDLMRDDKWRSLDSTIGVHSLIMQGDRPVCCPQGLVEHFLGLTNEDGVLDFKTSFRPGQKALVVRGPFSSLPSRLAKHGSNGRVQILLDIMNSNINATMGTRNIVPRVVEAPLNS